jgi:hypothetical protein
MLLEPVDPNEQFRSRRRQARKRRAVRRVLALSVVAVTAAALTLGARFLTDRDTKGAGAEKSSTSAPAPKPQPKPQPRALPAEIRGVHITMALASLEGKVDEYLALKSKGLNTLELDIKDENGEVGFRRPAVALAHETGAAKRYYNPREVAAAAHAQGVYLVGRIVVFEDPILSSQKPGYAIRTRDGGVWHTAAGLGWVNPPYDHRVWKYVTDLGAAGARAGFDEIQFDYVRFPTDGDLSNAVFNHKTRQSKARVISGFLEYASSRLRPLGVRVSADVFGLSATRNMGIGQRPDRIAPYLDAIYPMVYPSHFGPGEYNLPDPNAQPGRTVALALRDFDAALRGTKTRLVPWLQDFSLGRTYSLSDVRDQIQAARDAGAEGFLLWNAEGVYNRAALSGP